MIIPFQQLSAAALDGLIEEFITREGTDYGEVECSLDEKVGQIKSQLRSGEVVIVYDSSAQSTSIVSRRDIGGLR